MKTSKRIISGILTVLMLMGVFPFSTLVPKVSAAETVTETLFDSSTLNSLHLQSKDFEHNGASTPSATIGGKFSHSSSSHVYAVYAKEGSFAGKSSYYPSGINYYRSENQQKNNSWYVNSVWTPNTKEKEILNALITSDNKLQIGARYDGWYDTQGGVSAGQAWVTVGQYSSSGGTNGSTKTQSTKVSKCKYHNESVGWLTLKSTYDYFILNLGGTEGSGGIRKKRNYARVACPEVYLRDTQAPYVKSITLCDNANGNKNFAAGDTITVEVKFNEPIRVNDYNKTFSLSGSGLNNFSVTAYSDYTQTVTFTTTVEDSANLQIKKGKFSLTLTYDSSRITDLAGNGSTGSTVTMQDKDAIVSGLVPRVTRISYVSADIYSSSSYSYESRNSVEEYVKPGDRLYFDVYLNQGMKSANVETSPKSSIYMKVGDTDAYAELVGAFNGTNEVPLPSSNTLPTEEFNRLRYRFKVPSAENGDKIYLPAQNTDGYWEITDNSDWLDSIQGNLILEYSSSRLNLDSQTSIKADGTEILPIIYIDNKGPELTLTDENGNVSDKAYASYGEAKIADTKYNSYTFYIKSDEEVMDNMSATLYCYDIQNLAISYAESHSCVAYTGDAPLEGMQLTFDIPANVDTSTHRIYLDVSATDKQYNKSSQRFYLAADTAAPNITVKSSELKTTNKGTTYWKFDFDVEDNCSQENSKLYYRFGTDDEYKFVDSATSFVVTSPEVNADENLFGTIQYYAEDGMGNRTEVSSVQFYLPDMTGICWPKDVENVGAYLPSRDIEFEGLDAPETSDSITVYDYLVYKIGTGDWKSVQKSAEDAVVAIPKSDLFDGALITYKKVTAISDALDLNAATPEFNLVYHCDDAAPEISFEIEKDLVGNADTLKITAPTGSHPNNIEKMQIILYNGDAKIGDKDVTKDYVHGGAAYASICLEKLLNKYNLPSGEYTAVVELTDANGHVGSYTVMEDESIIIDAPVLQNLAIVSANDETVAYAEADGKAVTMTAEALEELLLEKGFDAASNEYKLSAEVRIRYEGEKYPVNADNDTLSYAISTDGGVNWTEFTDEDMEYSDTAKIVEADGARYAVYEVLVPIPAGEHDGACSYIVKVKSGSNPYVSDGVCVTTLTDNTAPQISVVETAIGSDEGGWSETVDYTNDRVKVNIVVNENGPLPDVTYTYINKIVDVNGKLVDEDDFDSYAVLNDSDGELTAQILQACTVVFTCKDAFGNTASIAYTCSWIDDIHTGYKVYDEDTEVYKYVLLKNFDCFVVAAEKPGSLEVSDAGQERFSILLNQGVFEAENLASMAGARNGDLNEVWRFYQRDLCSQEYDIVCGVYDRHGELQTFRLTTTVTETEKVVASEFTSTVKDLGNTIHAVQKLEFNQPVAQLSSELAAELREGAEIERSDISLRELVFSTTVYAVLDAYTEGNVYVTDKFGQITKVEVDVSGTEFVDYAGYTVSYTDGEDVASNEYVYGSNSTVNITVSGNDGISVILPISNSMSVTAVGEKTYDLIEYYDTVYMTLDCKTLSGEGTVYAADLKIKNTTSLEEYNDAIVFRYDNAPPVLLDSIEMVRHDSYDPGKVVYLFYDRRSVVSVMEDVGDGYEEKQSVNGIYYAQYMENSTPVIKAIDSEGNETIINGQEIDDIIYGNTWTEGVDFTLSVTDENGNALEDGQYYTSVVATLLPVDGGKSFMLAPATPVTVLTEVPVLFKLSDEDGNKQVYRYVPPVDRTAPTISAVQNNSGSMVSEIIYTVTASDAKSGVVKVYYKKADTEGAVQSLTADENGQYTFTVKDSDDYIVYAEDALGNVAETRVSSNSQVVGELAIEVSQSIEEITNQTVQVRFSAEDGRRIYLKVDETADNTLATDDYLLVGNDIYIDKNGELTLTVSDEIGNKVSKSIAITNIDKTPPSVKAYVEEVTGDDGAVDTSKARITFKAEAEDHADAVYLLRLSEDAAANGYTQEKLAQIYKNYIDDPMYRYSDEFKEFNFNFLSHDIYLATTYVDVTTNGLKRYYFIDAAGNVSTAVAEVTIIDSDGPVIEEVKWSFDYLAGEEFDTTENSSGTVAVTNGTVDVSKAVTGHVTNKPVTVSVTADEPVVLYGESNAEYSTSVSKTFYENGIYRFVVMDKASNLTELTVTVSNIINDDVYLELTYPDDLILVKGQESEYKPEQITSYTVYKYNNDTRVNLEDGEYTVKIIYNGFDKDNITNNTFDRNSPYTIQYTAWDEAGNKTQRTKKVVLCDVDDMLVTVNGNLPDSSGYIAASGQSAVAAIQNYSGAAVVKLVKGQYNGAQMKTRGTVVEKTDSGYTLDFADGNGWYTLYVRTLYQDMFVVRIYVTATEK